jgi:hypothetical protein
MAFAYTLKKRRYIANELTGILLVWTKHMISAVERHTEQELRANDSIDQFWVRRQYLWATQTPKGDAISS